MAIYHCHTKSISRASGRTATASAAYRAGEKILDTRQDVIHDYTRKQGVESKTLIFPSGVATILENRSQLWNAAEAAEKRKDARTGREFELALPEELSADQRKELALEFAFHLTERYGVAADVSIHAPNRRGDERNHHAHILIPTRQITQDGLGAKTDLELEDTALRAQGKPIGREQITTLREAWAEMANRALTQAGHSAQIDHRSIADQGIDREPTIHLGPTAAAMEREGIATDRGNINREIIAANQAREIIKAEIKGLQAELATAQEARAVEQRQEWREAFDRETKRLEEQAQAIIGREESRAFWAKVEAEREAWEASPGGKVEAKAVAVFEAVFGRPFVPREDRSNKVYQEAKAEADRAAKAEADRAARAEARTEEERRELERLETKLKDAKEELAIVTAMEPDENEDPLGREEWEEDIQEMRENVWEAEQELEYFESGNKAVWEEWEAELEAWEAEEAANEKAEAPPAIQAEEARPSAGAAFEAAPAEQPEPTPETLTAQQPEIPAWTARPEASTVAEAAQVEAPAPDSQAEARAKEEARKAQVEARAKAMIAEQEARKEAARAKYAAQDAELAELIRYAEAKEAADREAARAASEAKKAARAAKWAELGGEPTRERKTEPQKKDKTQEAEQQKQPEKSQDKGVER